MKASAPKSRIAIAAALATFITLSAGAMLSGPADAVACSNSSFAGGTGTSGDPFIVDDSDALACLNDASYRNHSPAYSFLLVKDIDLSGVTWSNPGYGSSSFNGVFDGGGFTISHLDAFASGTWGGIFYSITGTLKNLHVSGTVSHDTRTQLVSYQVDTGGLAQNIVADGSITSTTSNGGMFWLLAGTGDQLLSNVDVTCADRDCGGLAARLWNTGTLTQSGSTGDVSSTNVNTSYGTGGLFGFAQGSSLNLTNVSSTGNVTITAGQRSGAIIGLPFSPTTSITVTNALATGTLSDTSGSNTGALIGGPSGAGYPPGTLTITKSLWRTGMSNNAAIALTLQNAGGTTKTLTNVNDKSVSDLQSPTTFTSAPYSWSTSNWNFTNGSYPELKIPATGAITASAASASITAGSTQQIQLTAGTYDAAVSGIGIYGADAADFSQTNDCGSTLSAGASCTIDITYSGSSTGAASLYFASNVRGKSVALTGSSSPSPSPSPTVSPTPTPSPSPTVDPKLNPADNPTDTAIPTGGVPVGDSQLLVSGVPTTVRVSPNSSSNPNGLSIAGDGFTMALAGLGANGQPLQLDANGALVLEEDRSAHVEGTGFQPDSQVAVYIYSNPTFVGTVTTDANGSFSDTLQLPISLETGNHTLQANGFTKDGAVRSMSLGVVMKPASGRLAQTASLPALPSKVKAGKPTVLVKHHLTTDQGQPIKVAVRCAPLLKGLRPAGDVRTCNVTRTKAGRISVTVRTKVRTDIAVTYRAAGTTAYNPYVSVRHTHSV